LFFFFRHKRYLTSPLEVEEAAVDRQSDVLLEVTIEDLAYP
jgi:hypothetical protein